MLAGTCTIHNTNIKKEQNVKNVEKITLKNLIIYTGFLHGYVTVMFKMLFLIKSCNGSLTPY